VVYTLVYSPDGRTLAFIGFMTGPSADLYSYSLDKDKVVHLSGGPSQAYYPLWSPDGKYIMHFGVTTFGTGAGYTTSGMWAARANNSGVITLPNPTGGGDTVVGWPDAYTFLLYSFNIACGPNNLRTVNIESLKHEYPQINASSQESAGAPEEDSMPEQGIPEAGHRIGGGY